MQRNSSMRKKVESSRAYRGGTSLIRILQSPCCPEILCCVLGPTTYIMVMVARPRAERRHHTGAMIKRPQSISTNQLSRPVLDIAQCGIFPAVVNGKWSCYIQWTLHYSFAVIDWRTCFECEYLLTIPCYATMLVKPCQLPWRVENSTYARSAPKTTLSQPHIPRLDLPYLQVRSLRQRTALRLLLIAFVDV